MNDKISIRARNFNVLPNADNYIETKTQILRKNGEIISNQERKFINADIVNIDFFGNDLLGITFNPQKVNEKYIGDADFTSIQIAYATVNDKLSDLGIDVNLATQEIKEYHNSFDVEINEAYDLYFAVLNIINPQLDKGFQKWLDNDSIYCQNESNTKTLVVYDKLSELHNQIEKSKLSPAFKLPNDLIRFETRINKKNKKSRFALEGLNADKYINLRNESKKFITKTFFYGDFSVNSCVEYLISNFSTIRNDRLLITIGSYYLLGLLNAGEISIRDILPKYKSNSREYQKLRNFEKLLYSSNINFVNDALAKSLYYELDAKLSKVA